MSKTFKLADNLKWTGSVIKMGLIFEKKQSSAELQQILHIQRSKLEQAHSKLSERMEQGRQEAKECLARGDESGFRIASRK